MWGKPSNGGDGGSTVSPSTTNGKVKVNGSDITVYNDTALDSKATHTNRATLDKFSEDGSGLLFNGAALGGGGGGTLPTATSNTLGVIKVGNGLSVTPDGVLSAGGGTVSASGRVYAMFSLRGGIVNVKKNTEDNTCNYTFPNLDSNRYRRMFVWTPSGGQKFIDIPDGTLNDFEALVYNITSNTLTTKYGTWGNIPIASDEFLFMYNNLGIIGGGILQQYVVMGGDLLSIPIREVEATLVSNTGSIQGIFIVGDKLYKCAHSNDEHTDFVNISEVSLSNLNGAARAISHNLGHLNAPSYSSVKNSLIVGNGSKSFTLLPKGWIIPNFSTVVQGSTIDFNAVDKIELDFTQLTGEYKGQLCWGYESSDIVYLFTNDNRVLRKVLLGKGTNNLGSGVYVDGTATPNRYNGSYSILDTYYSRTVDTLGGMFFYKGSIYTGVKGAYNIRKCIPLSSGYFNSEYIPIAAGWQGDCQGIAVNGTDVYTFSDYKGYKFNVSEL